MDLSQLQWYFWVGLIGSIGISIFTLPQLINLIKTKNTAFINIPTFAIYLLGCFLFLTGGILMVCANNPSGGWPLIIAQSVCGGISTTIFIWKMINYFAAKKAKMSELEYIKHKINKRRKA